MIIIVNINLLVYLSKHVMITIQITATERFSNDSYQKTKTKAITLTNHNRGKQCDEPITVPSNNL